MTADCPNCHKLVKAQLGMYRIDAIENCHVEYMNGKAIVLSSCCNAESFTITWTT